MYGLRTGTKKEGLKAILKDRDDWRTKKLKEVIKSRFGVEYSLIRVSRILITM